MRWSKSIGCLGLAVSAAFNPAPVFARGGLDATQMQVVALDASSGCKRTFFRSSQHFDNTIFVVPRVVPGAGPDGKRTFDMIWLEDERKWVLNLRLYFPTNSEELKVYGASMKKRDLDACNFDQVKASINDRIAAKDREQKEVRTISPMPLTSIQVKLPMIDDVAKIGIVTAKDGSEVTEVDQLNYYGKFLTAVFKITEKEKALFEAMVVNPDGIAGQVKMHYMATHNEGSIIAKVNTSGIKAAFNGAIAGAAYVVKANLAMNLEKAVNSTTVTINTQGAKSDMAEKIMGSIIDQITKAADHIANSKKEKREKSNLENPGVGQIATEDVLEAISTTLTGEFRYNNYSAPETATSLQQIDINQTGVEDPNIVKVYIKAHYQDPNPGFYVREKQSFTISPARWWIEEIKYNEYTTLLSTSDFVDLRLKEHFPDINDPAMSIENRHTLGKPVVAVGEYKYAAHLRTGIYERGIKVPFQYVWRRVDLLPERSRGNSNRIILTAENLDDLHFGVSFTQANDRKPYKLSELLKPNPWFTATFDPASGRIKITAKQGQNLGNVEFREFPEFSGKSDFYQTEPKQMNVVEEVSLGTFFNWVVKRVSFDPDEDAITVQKVMQVNLTRPKDETNVPVESSLIKSEQATELPGQGPN